VIPTPISTCRYFHRTLNVPKLVDSKFTYVPRNMTVARMSRQFKVPSTPALSRAGLREMEERDVSAVAELYRRYMERFEMIPLLEEDDVRHQFLSGRGKGEIHVSTGRRPGQVVWTYVVEASSSLLRLLSAAGSLRSITLESGIARHHRLLLVLHFAIDDCVEPAARPPRGSLSLLLRI
jgi:hypothetical protein